MNNSLEECYLQEEIQKYADGCRSFLDCCKTEREAAAHIVDAAKKAGFRDLEECFDKDEVLKPGDKVYFACHGKAVGLFRIGEKPIKQGMHLICSHIDSPRLDLKPNPLYEKENLAFLKTHYYGGIKKFQWVVQPLSLHGTVVKKNGDRLNIILGENEDEPVFYIPDLPAHLSEEQDKRPMETGIEGESLNVLIGSIPLCDNEDFPIKRKVLSLLNKYYGIKEDDFKTAELELVPAGKARNAGLDNSMIVAYGQDDRVCVYGALRSILESEVPHYTAGVIFADKEEVGSKGNTGMSSHLMENMVARIIWLMGEKDYMSVILALEKSKMLSADVAIAYDPTNHDLFETANTAKLGFGPVLTKYAGHGGKSGCNDASAEFLAYIRDVFEKEDIKWQTGEDGKIDAGGGGTIAPFAATYGMEVLDFGVPILSMHAPYEMSSKADVFECYRAMKAFLYTSHSMEKYTVDFD